MRHLFTDKKFGSNSLKMIESINEILSVYDGDGFVLTLRQLYYQLVTKNIIENTERSYKNIGNIVSDGRLAGLIDWEIIKDLGRECVSNSHWESPREILNSCAQQFRIDRWKDQSIYVEVMVEKQALEGVLLPVCTKWDVPFTANKGYSSSSAMYEAGKRIRDRLDKNQEVIIIYLGDHDPSGIDMSRDVEDRLRLFSSSNNWDAVGVYVERIALNMDQVVEMKLEKNPAKITDSRAQAYIKRFGKSSWELDAIEAKTLANLVSAAIEKNIDFDLWGKSGQIQQQHRDKIAKMAKGYRV